MLKKHQENTGKDYTGGGEKENGVWHGGDKLQRAGGNGAIRKSNILGHEKRMRKIWGTT